MPNEFDSGTTSEPEISIAVLNEGAAGERFGKYLLVGELASGGMAKLLLAIHQGIEGFSRVVALKCVLPHLTESSEFVQMFLDEARIAARLEHPNIVRTYEFGAEAGRYFMEMEYLAGEDLHAVLKLANRSRKPLPVNFVVEVVSRVCAGLHFAHELRDSTGRPLGLVHRDVTPGNIVVTYFGEVKLIDFGVAKATTNVVRTRAGVLKGKIAYMSPEQLRARGVDRRSDVFSTGVVLWELLAGMPLFARDTDAATLYAIVNDPVPPVRDHRPDVPEELAAIVDRALARDPEDRWATAEQMQIVLDDFLAGLALQESLGPGATPTGGDSGARRLAREMERLFGAARGNAKRAIAQNRSLAANILAMSELPTDVRASPIGSVGAQLSPPTSSTIGPPVRPGDPLAPRRPRAWLVAVIGAAVVAAAGGAIVAMKSRGDVLEPAPDRLAPVALTVASSPAGAAIYIGGEPTGMKTPATLPGIAPGRVAIRLELAGYPASETVIEVAPGANVTREIQLGARLEPGRLVVTNLPSGATVTVDDDDHDYAAGEAIALSSGRHRVRVVVHTKTIVDQTIEMAGGDQTWELADHDLQPRRPR